MGCWPAYLTIVFFLGLLFYDMGFRRWYDIPFHGILGLISITLVTLCCAFLGETISGFIVFVPAIVIMIYMLVEVLRPAPPPPSPPQPPSPPSECIDPRKIPDCKKLVQVLVKKEDAALARCKAKQEQPPPTVTVGPKC